MEGKDELRDILQKVALKLRDLQQASALDKRAFSVIVLFVALLIFMMVLPCVYSYCCKEEEEEERRKNMEASDKLQPLQTSEEEPED